ncbi:MAG: cytochrome P450 [Myxococcales bacterium]|nr:cytochrome P450 [Myxococcales bacterium]
MTLPPGPERLGRFDVLGRLRLLSSMAGDILGFVGQRFERFGDTYHVDEGSGQHLLVTRDPDVIRDVLVTSAGSFRKSGGANDRLKPILGDGLLTADGEVWKRQRRLIQPAFRHRAVAAYAEIMVDEAQQLRFADGAEVDLSQQMMELTLRIVCRALFGHDVSAQTQTVAATMDALRDVTRPRLAPGWLPTPGRARRRRAVAAIDALIAQLVTARRDRGAEEAGTDLLGMLLRAQMPDTAVRDELVTFFLAGHETTSHALTWSLLLLGEHEHELQRVVDELDQVLGERVATPADLRQLVFTERAIQESMRLYPPAFALPRVASAPVVVGPYAMQPGWQIVNWIWHCQRHPDLFEAPASFRPDRFEAPAFPAHAYLPFGAGTRMCVGAGFAQLELRLLLATLLRRYRFEPTGPRPGVSPQVTLAPRGQVPVRVVAR